MNQGSPIKSLWHKVFKTCNTIADQKSPNQATEGTTDTFCPMYTAIVPPPQSAGRGLVDE
jgi:hypothetical protein